MKVIDYISKKNADNTINIISKKNIDTLSSEDYRAESMSKRNGSNGNKKSKNKKGKNNPNTIFYGKVQYLLKNKKMMGWISDIEILNESCIPSESIRLKKEYVLPDMEQIEI